MTVPAELSRAEQALANASTVAEVKSIYDTAEAYRVWVSSRAEQNRAATVKLRAGAKGGAMLADMPKAVGGRGKSKTPDSLSGVLSIESEAAAQKLSSRWQRLADLEDEGTLGAYFDSDPEEISHAGLLAYATTPADPPGDEWYTPPWLFDALGLRFDVDVCAPVDSQLRTVPADRVYTIDDDGLTQPWDGLIWCNPPYSNPTPWAERMIEHGNGLLLSHVPINGLWALRAWWGCSTLRLLQGMEFLRPSGELQRPGYWLHLVAFGDVAGDAVRAMTVDDWVRERFRPSVALVPWSVPA